MTTRFRMFILASIIMLIATIAQAAPLPRGVYLVDCRTGGNPAKIYNILGVLVGYAYNWPCTGANVKKIVITEAAIQPPPPSYDPSDPVVWGGLAPMQLVDVLKASVLANGEPPIDVNEVGPLESLPTLTCNETDLQ